MESTGSTRSSRTKCSDKRKSGDAAPRVESPGFGALLGVRAVPIATLFRLRCIRPLVALIKLCRWTGGCRRPRDTAAMTVTTSRSSGIQTCGSRYARLPDSLAPGFLAFDTSKYVSVDNPTNTICRAWFGSCTTEQLGYSSTSM